MRFFKVFLVSFSAVIGIVGAGIGIMYATGQFTQDVVQPEVIAFETSNYEVTEDFEMLITSPTENVTETKVTLSFESGDFIEEEDNKGITYISNSIVSVPKKVKIGVPFTVFLTRTFQDMDDDGINETNWISGGITTLKATSSNILAQVQTTTIFVDVPVFSLSVETRVGLETPSSQDIFNISSNFWAVASFHPASSQFRYSRDGSDGSPVAYKKVFFSSLSSNIEEVETPEEVRHYAQCFKALNQADNVQINAQCFANAKEEDIALESVSNFPDEERQKEEILALLSEMNEQLRGDGEKSVDFAPLVIGNFFVASPSVPTCFNNSVKIFANYDNFTNNESNLGISIVAKDEDQTPLQSEIENVAIAVAILGGDGYEPATSDQIFIQGFDSLTYNVFEQDFEFFFPYKHSTDVNKSYWNLTALVDGLEEARLIILLFEENELGEKIPNEYSLTEVNPKYIINVDPATIISNRISWEDPIIDTQTLYIYEDEDVSKMSYQEFNLNLLPIIVPQENTYKVIRYFAYLEDSFGQPINVDLNNYIITSGKMATHEISSETIILYEIPNGIITPKDVFPENAVLKVVFASVKTTASGQVRYVSENYYLIDLYSTQSSALGALETIPFNIQKTIKTVNQYVFSSFNLDNEQFIAHSESTLAVVNGNEDAFDIIVNISNSQIREIFIKDWNENKISFEFYIDGILQVDLFRYDKEVINPLDIGPFEFPITVGMLAPNTASKNFEIKIRYTRNNQAPEISDIYITEFHAITTPSTFLYKGGDPSDDPILEIYDGKIDFLSFNSSLNVASDDGNPTTPITPIIVQTSLIEGSLLSGDDAGVYVAQTGSTSSFSLNGVPDVINVLFYDGTARVIIIARDKYGIEIQSTNYWMLSSDPSIIAVDSTGQSLIFLKPSATLVEISISSTFGQGGETVDGEFSIFFKVETGGRVVDVRTNVTGGSLDYENIFQNYTRSASNPDVNNLFTLDNLNNYFTQTIISKDTSSNLSIVGSTGTAVYFYGLNPLLKVFYALEDNVQTGKYKFFDIGELLRFSRVDTINFGQDENAFINFIYDNDADDTGRFLGFQIIKDFGQETPAYLNLKVETDIGFTIQIQIEIRRKITANFTTTGHEAYPYFAQRTTADNHEYIGVFTNLGINLDFLDFSTTSSLSSFYPLIYSPNENGGKPLAHTGVDAQNPISINGDDIFCTLTLDDVTGYTLKHYIFILSSEAFDPEATYQRQLYDFAIDLYFNLNPNINAVLNPDHLTMDVDTLGTPSTEDDLNASIVISSQTVSKVISLTNESDAMIHVFRKHGDEPLSLTKALSNYVEARITNSLGEIYDSSNFEIVYNSGEDAYFLKLKDGQMVSQSESFYISIFHFISPNEFIVKKFNITVVPSILKIVEERFVIYNGLTYLQLESGESLSFQSYGEIDGISSFFGIVNPPFEPSVSFVDVTMHTSYWDIILGGEGVGTLSIKSFITSIVAGQISVTLTIPSIASMTVPIIIMPRLSPLVLYNEIELKTGIDAEQLFKNAEANSDLANLFSLNYLISKDFNADGIFDDYGIYDVVSDGLTSADAFSIVALLEPLLNNFGLFVKDEISINYSIRNGQGGTAGTELSGISVDNYGILTTPFVGVETFFIITAQVQGLTIYYRLKIVPSLSFETYYPYIDNFEETENEIAEIILYKSGDQNKIITLNTPFTKEIPATNQEIPNTEDALGNQALIASRLMLLRDTGGETFQFSLMPFTISNVVINNVEQGRLFVQGQTYTPRTVVAPAYYANFVEINNESGNFNVLLKNNGWNYVIELKIITTNNCEVIYKFAIEYVSFTHELVTGTGLIGSMSPWTDNSIDLDSPPSGAPAPSSEWELYENDILNSIYLRRTSGTSGDDTSLLRYHIFDNYTLDELIGLEIVDKTIFARYTVNTIHASLVFYSKYGIVKIVPLNVHSQIKVVEIEGLSLPPTGEQTYEIKLSDSVYSGGVYDLQEIITFIDKDGEGRYSEFTSVVWSEMQIQGSAPSYVLLSYTGETIDSTSTLGDDKSKLLILPTDIDGTFTLNCTVLLGGIYSYNFVYTLNILHSLDSSQPVLAEVLTTSINHYIDGIDLHYGTEPVAIEIFGTIDDMPANRNNILFVNSGNEILFTPGSTGSQMYAEFVSASTDYRYRLEVTILSGNDVIELIEISPVEEAGLDAGSEGRFLILRTRAVAYDTVINLSAELIFDDFSVVSYYQVVLKPNTNIEFNYPKPDGTNELDEESIYYDGAKVRMNAAADFQTLERIQISHYSGFVPSSIMENVYIVVSKGAGNVEVTPSNWDNDCFLTSQPGHEHSLATCYFKYGTEFTFDFTGVEEFGEVNFEVFVSGISRESYSLVVYKKISSIFQVEINNINNPESAVEQFFVGEDRKDIFNGVQAITFGLNNSTSILGDPVTMSFYKDNTSLGASIYLTSADRGADKVVKILELISAFEGLTLNNLRIRIYNEVTQTYYGGPSQYFTISELSSGSGAYFRIGIDGNPVFKLAKRINIKYLGFEVTDTDILNMFKVKDLDTPEQSEQDLTSFQLSNNGIGGQGMERLSQEGIEISYGEILDDTWQYLYDLKVNVAVGTTENTIYVGDAPQSVINNFQITRIDGSGFFNILENDIMRLNLYILPIVPLEFILDGSNCSGTITAQIYRYRTSLSSVHTISFDYEINGTGSFTYMNDLTTIFGEIVEDGDVYFIYYSSAPAGLHSMDVKIGATTINSLPGLLTGSETIETLLSLPNYQYEHENPWLNFGFRYADNEQVYNRALALDQPPPLQHTSYDRVSVVTGTSYYYDWNYIANGSPNSGLLATLILSYTFPDENLVCYTPLTVRIEPSWIITAYNADGQTNSIDNPEVIDESIFGIDLQKDFSLTDKNNLNNHELTIIDARVNGMGLNRAHDSFSYAIDSPNNVVSIARINEIRVGEELTGRTITIWQPDFAERTIILSISDIYGYEIKYYYKVLPENEIEFSFFAHGDPEYTNYFEGDSFMLRYGLSETEAGIEHILVLTRPTFTNEEGGSVEVFYTVSFRILTSDGNIDLGAVEPNGNFNGLGTEFNIGFIDNYFFNPSSKVVQVYFEINLCRSVFLDDVLQNAETYTINSTNIILRQRYGTVISNTHVRDGAAFDLIDYVMIQDYKENAPIGEPTIIDEKTLNIATERDNYQLNFNLIAKNDSIERSSEISTSYNSTNPEDKQNKYIMLSDYFDDINVTEPDFNFFVRSVTEITDNCHYRISVDTVSGELKIECVNGISHTHTAQAFNITLKDIGGSTQTIGPLNFTGTSLTTIISGFSDITKVGIISFARTDGSDPIEFSSYNDRRIDIITVENYERDGDGNFILDEFEQKIPKVVNVKLNGPDDRSIPVELNKNGLQSISVLENWNTIDWGVFVSENVYLNSVEPVLKTDLYAIKNMTYYNDTVEILIGPSASSEGSSMSVRIFRKRGEIITPSNESISISYQSYERTVSIGLSKLFNEKIQIGDVYSLRIDSMSGNVPSFITIKWPSHINGLSEPFTVSSGTPATYMGTFKGEFGVADLLKIYTVSSFEDIKIELNGKIGRTKIELDSLGQYIIESDKIVDVNRFYLIEFNEAWYILNGIPFNVSPYFHSIDTTGIYTGNRTITEYSQISEIEGTRYVVPFESWAGGLTFTDGLFNSIYYDYDEDGIVDAGEGKILLTEMGRPYSITNPQLPIVSFVWMNGRAELQNDLSIITAVNVTTEEYFEVGVRVAINGIVFDTDEDHDVLDENIDWLPIGSIRFWISSNEQYFMPQGSYIVSVGADSTGDEQYLRYINYDDTYPITFSINKLFADHNITFSGNIIRMGIDGTGPSVESVYLKEREINNYQLSYYDTSSTKIDIIATSTPIDEVGGLPVITLQGLSESGTAIVTASYQGSPSRYYYGTYNRPSYETGPLFTTLPLSSFSWTDGVSALTYEQLLLGFEEGEDDIGDFDFSVVVVGADPESEIEIASVMWTKLNLNILDTYDIQFYGSELPGEESPITTLIPNIDCSKLFEIKKIGVVETISNVKVTAMPNSTEYYAITQIATLASGDVVEYAQTYCYRVENNTSTSQVNTITLRSWNYEQFGLLEAPETVIVVVYKIDTYLGFNDLNIVNLDPNSFYVFEEGIVTFDSGVMTNFENTVSVITKQTYGGPKLLPFNINGFNYIDPFRGSFYQIDATEEIFGAIYTRKLSGSSPVTFNVDLGTGSDYSNGTIVTNSDYSETDSRIVYTYEYASSDRNSFTFGLNDNAITILYGNVETEGKLVWHELIAKNGMANPFPINKVFYKFKQNSSQGEWDEISRTQENPPIYLIEAFISSVYSPLTDGNLITNLWDGTVVISDSIHSSYSNKNLLVTYDETPDDEMVYFKYNDYDLWNYGTYRINLGELLDGYLDWTLFGEISIIDITLRQLLTLFEASVGNIYEIEYDSVTIGWVYYDSLTSSNDIYLDQAGALFDLIDDTKIVYSKLNFVLTTESTLGWTVSEGEGYYFFEQERGDVDFARSYVVDSGLVYNLFDIFERNLISSDENTVTVTKILDVITLTADPETPPAEWDATIYLQITYLSFDTSIMTTIIIDAQRVGETTDYVFNLYDEVLDLICLSSPNINILHVNFDGTTPSIVYINIEDFSILNV